MKTPKTTTEQIDAERAAYKTLIPDWPVGSTVRVVRKAKSHEAGWDNSWCDDTRQRRLQSPTKEGQKPAPSA